MDLTDNHSPALLLQVVIHFSLLFPFIFFILSFRSVLFSLKFFSNLLPPSLYSLLTVFPSFGQSLTARSLFPFHHHCLPEFPSFDRLLVEWECCWMVKREETDGFLALNDFGIACLYFPFLISISCLTIKFQILLCYNS